MIVVKTILYAFLSLRYYDDRVPEDYEPSHFRAPHPEEGKLKAVAVFFVSISSFTTVSFFSNLIRPKIR